MTTEVAVEELAVKFRKQRIENINVESVVNITSDSSYNQGWNNPCPDAVSVIVKHMKWSELRVLRLLNKQWHKTVNDTVRHVTTSTITDIPISLLAKFSNLELLTFKTSEDVKKSEVVPLSKLTNLKGFSLQGMRVRDDAAKALRKLSYLQALDMTDVTLSLNGIQNLDRLTRLNCLKSLSLVYVDVDRQELPGNACAEAISKLTNLTYLEMRLDMNGDVLNKLSGLKNLTELCLSSITLNIDDLYFMKNMHSLSILRVPWSHFSTYSADEIDILSSLIFLDIGATDVVDDSLVHFSKLTKLQTLICKDNSISDDGVEHLSTLTNLTTLDLSHAAGLSDVCSMINLSNLKSLKILNMNGTHVGNSDIEYLNNLKNLVTLDLGLTSVNEKGLEMLSKMKNIKHLNMDSTRNNHDEYIPEDAAIH